MAWVEAYQRTKWHLDPSNRLATTYMGQKLGVCAPFIWGRAGSHLTQCGLSQGAKALLHTKWHFDPSNRLATIDMGQNVGGCCAPFLERGAGSPCNAMSPGPRPTALPGGILIHPAVWPQYTNVTDRTDRQRSHSIGRTVLQTVAQQTMNE